MTQTITDAAAPRWVIRLTRPSSDPARRLGGLPLALRLALDAQASGAEAVVVPPELAALRPLLHDERLRLPIVASPPPDVHVVELRASHVLPRGLLGALAQRELQGPPRVRSLETQPFEHTAPYGFTPIDVTDAASAQRAERALFRSLRKPADGWTSRWLNRYLSLALSRWLVRTPLRPNQVSVAILGIGLCGAWLASRGGWAGLALGAALLQTQSVLDGCDGEMSRITYRGSLLGEWLDTLGDDLSNYGFFAGAAWGLYQQEQWLPYLVAGGVTVLSGVIGSGIEYRYLIKVGSGDLLKYPLSVSSADGAPSWFDKLRPLFKRDTFVFITFVAALLGLVGPMLFVFAVGAVGVLLSVLSAELRMARERAGA